MPRGDPNSEIGILQMADNAAAEKSGAAKYGHASRRHTRKYRAPLGNAIIFSALPEAKQASAQARESDGSRRVMNSKPVLGPLLRAGPRVRIRLPPGGSPLRT